MNKSVNLYSFQCLIVQRVRTTPVKVIVEHLTLLEKMRDPLPFVVFNSLERKNDPCKSDSPTMYLFHQRGRKKCVTLFPFQCIIQQKGRTTPVKVIAQDFTFFEKMRDTLPFFVYNSLERKNDPCKSDSPTFYPFRKNA